MSDVLDRTDEPDMPEVEETEDGGAVVRDKAAPKPDKVGVEEHFANLAEELTEDELRDIAHDLLDEIERDLEAQSERDETYQKGIERTGLVNDAPGGANFEGATKVTHPILGEACIDFCSRASSELLPPDGIVKQKIEGNWSKDKSDRAWRKAQHMNYQLGVQCRDYRKSVEKVLTQMPLAGESYLKVTWNKRFRRPKFDYRPATSVVLPYGVASFEDSHRVTDILRLTEHEVRSRMRSGMYRTVELGSADSEEPLESARAQDDVAGVTDQGDTHSRLRVVYEVYCDYFVSADGEASSEWDPPYVITVDKSTREVLRIQRNWRPGDETQERMDYLVQWGMLPWDSAHYVGVWHLAGGLTKASIGALRALLDSAHINNAATMMRLKGARTGGQNRKIAITQIEEIEGPSGADDIRKIAMPLPFNPPSAVLFELLQFCLSEARGTVKTTTEVSDNPNVPVGTQLSRVEETMRVFKSIHTRLHEAQRQTLEIVHRLNSYYLDEEQVLEDLGELVVRRADYEGACDVHPVSDPNIFSDVQRLSQMQAVKSLQQASPQLYDSREVDKTILTLMRVPNIDQLMPPPANPPPMNPTAENMALAMGQQVAAYPDQDHIAHIKAHVSFLTSPIFGQNPIFQPTLCPAALKHLQQHLVMWYGASVHQILSKEAGADVTDALTLETDDQKLLARSIAALSPLVMHAAQTNFAQLLPVLQQVQQTVAKLTQPQIPPDPMAQVAMADVQRKTQEGQAKVQAEMARAQTEAQKDLQIEAIKAAQEQRRTDSTIVKAAIARDQAIDVAEISNAQPVQTIALPPLPSVPPADPPPTAGEPAPAPAPQGPPGAPPNPAPPGQP